MNRLFSWFQPDGSVLLAVVLLSGCAFTTDYVSLSYVPQEPLKDAAGRLMGDADFVNSLLKATPPS